MSSVNNTSYICEKLIEISTRNCNNNKLLQIPNQLFIFDGTLVNSIHTIATRDIACLNSLNMLNTCCKNYITIKKE